MIIEYMHFLSYICIWLACMNRKVNFPLVKKFHGSFEVQNRYLLFLLLGNKIFLGVGGVGGEGGGARGGRGRGAY